MKFSECVQYFQALEAEPSRTAMTKTLAELLRSCSADDAKIVAYLAMGSLLPAYKDLQFNIASKGMVAIVAMFLQIPESRARELVLHAGDAGSVVEGLWAGTDQGLDLEAVHSELVNIAKISGTGSIEKKSEKLIELLSKMDASGAKCTLRIVAKTMRLGFSDMTFLDSLSWMAAGDKSLSKKLEHAFSICADLGLVAYTLKSGGIEAVEKMVIQVGIPIRPAAAERLLSAQAVIDRLGDCVAQPKLDGFRVQVHLQRVKEEVKVSFFSRNMLDMSDMFPELKALVSMLPVDSLICEGEAIVYDANTDSFLPFQETVKRKRKHGIEKMSEEMPLRLYLFDLLYLNGASMLEKTHKQRRVELLNVCNSAGSEALQVIEEKHIKTATELTDYFLTCIGSGLEGLVVKRQDAMYQPGKRNFNWIKLKRESHGSLIDSIDGVVLGYYGGRGKRARFGIGAFLLGVYDENTDSFKTTAKVGTGMTDDEWKDLKKRCDLIAVATQPKNIVCAKSLQPDVWVSPEIVCVIDSEEITVSPVHTAGKDENHLGYGLRFPRFVSYRDDKSAKDATTVAELKRLQHEQKS